MKNIIKYIMKNIMKILTIILLNNGISFASPLVVKSGEVRFTAIGRPGILKIRGESKGKFPKGSIKIENDSAAGEFEFELKDLDTGIDLRNEHMKENYLEVAKYPLAKLVFKTLPLNAAEMNSNINKAFKGALSLHGVTKDIEGEFVYKPKNKHVVANFKIKVSDFKIDIPKYLGITVSETVDIETILYLN